MLKSNAPEQDGMQPPFSSTSHERDNFTPASTDIKQELTTIGVDSNSDSPERGRRGYRPSSSSDGQHGSILHLPKNRSTGNLLQHAARSVEKDKARIRFSFDAGERDTMSR